MQNHISQILEQAIAAHKAGDLSNAEILYKQIIDLDPSNTCALHYLSVIFINIDRAEEAIPLLENAAINQASNPDLLYNLALAYQKIENIPEAIHYYKLVLALKPDFAMANNNIGVAYQHMGNLDVANMYLKKAFSIDPGCIEAYYNFAQSHHFTKSDQALIEEIELILSNATNNERDQIKLNFVLGKIYDNLKDYDTAFKYYSMANELKFHGFNMKAFSKYIDNVIQEYTHDKIKELEIPEQTNDLEFVFVVGMPRSSTTLVNQILSSHSNIQSVGENGFIGDIVDDLSELIHSDKTYPACLEDLRHETVANLTEKIRSLIQSMGLGTSIIVDKSPINFLHIGLILILFPNSKIVNCNRDPIDTCLSCFFQNFDKQHQYSYNLKSLAEFYNQYSRLMAHWRDLFSDRIFELRYESLVENQEETSKELIQYCELPWEDSCLSFYKSDTTVSTASKWQVRRPIYKTSIKKWKHYEPYIEELINNLKMEF